MERIDWQRLASILFCAAVGLALLLLVFRYALPVLLPFLLAYLLSRAVRRPAKAMASALHLPAPPCAVLLLVALSLLGGMLLWWGLLYLWREAIALAQRLSRDAGVASLLSDAEAWLARLLSHLGIAEDPPRLSTLLLGAFGELASKLPALLTETLSRLPTALFFLLLTLVASVYFCLEGEGLEKRLLELLPTSLRARLADFRAGGGRLLRRYLRGYFSLFLLTAGLLLLGFLLLRVEHALLLSLLISLADLLPVVGIGTVLIPWGILCLVTNESGMGLSLLVLYLTVSIVRQLAEPRILGKSLGIHPLLSLLFSYAGLSLFGFWGLVLAPFAVMLCKAALRRDT